MKLKHATTETQIELFAEQHFEDPDLALLVRTTIIDNCAKPESWSTRCYPVWQGLGLHHHEAGYVTGIFQKADGTIDLAIERGRDLDVSLDRVGKKCGHITVIELDKRSKTRILTAVDAALDLPR